MKKILIIGMLLGMGLLGVMAVNLTENPLVEVGHFQDVVTKSTPVVDVRAYGAKGDGVTDDTKAFQNAHAAAWAAGGGILYIPAGTYRVQLTIDDIGVWNDSPTIIWKGAGANATRLMAIDANEPTITVTGNGQWSWLWGFEDLSFDGNQRACSGFEYSDETPGVIGASFERVTFINCDVGFKNIGGLQWRFHNCSWTANNIGLWITADPDGTMHGGCGVVEGQSNFYVHYKAAVYIDGDNQAEQIRFRDCVFQGGATDGFGLIVKDWTHYWPLVFENCYFELVGSSDEATIMVDGTACMPAGVYLTNSRNVHIRNSKIDNHTDVTTHITLDSASELIVEDCLVESTTVISKSADSALSFVQPNYISGGGTTWPYYTEDVRQARQTNNLSVSNAPGPLESNISLAHTNMIGANATCAVNFTPSVTGAGATATFVNESGPMFDRTMQLVLTAEQLYTAGLKPFANYTCTSGKWYAWSFDIKGDAEALTGIYVSDYVVAGNSLAIRAIGVPVRTRWQRIWGLSSRTAGTDTAPWIWNTSVNVVTLNLSAFQLVEFDTYEQATEYIRSRLYAWPSTHPQIAERGLIVRNGATSAGYIDLYEDSDNGTGYTRFSVATVDLTNANIKDLADTPIELVAAQGAGTLIEVVSAVFLLDYGSNALTEPSAPDDLAIEYDDGSGAQIATWDSTALITATADTIEQVDTGSVAAFAAAANVNKNVVLLNTGGDYEGNAGNDTTMRVIVTYRLHTSLGL